MERWHMRLTIVNEEGGQTAVAMYPDSLYAILETLDECQIPYGNGRYRHLAVSPNSVPADVLQMALTPVIESEENPPSIRELNYLGELIQEMTAQERKRLAGELLAAPQATISDVYTAIQHICPDRDVECENLSLKERSVQLGAEAPYIRIQLIRAEDDPGDEKAGIWVNCPATEEQIAEAAKTAGVESLEELQPNMMDGAFSYSDLYLTEQDGPFESFHEINRLAVAMKEHGVLQEIGKFKAVLYFEGCTDFEKATELVGQLDDYEFFSRADLERKSQEVGFPEPDNDVLSELGIEETPYGFVRQAGGISIDELMDRHLHGRIEVEIDTPSYGPRRSEVSENKQRFAADLASASQQLYELEKELQGAEGAFSKWLRSMYEVNMDFEIPFLEAVDEVCCAIRYVDQQYGRDIAQQLYNTNRIVLASELRQAAQYLSLGGRFEDLAELAYVGFFMGESSQDEMCCAITFMNSGGAAEDVFRATKLGSVDTQAKDEHSLALY